MTLDFTTVLQIGREALLLAITLSAPPVLVAMLLGLLISIFQAATQIQEQTLTVVPKIVAVYGVVLAFGLSAIHALVGFARQLLEMIGDMS
ncbi:MAG: flagellar biosynthetic protein FliQ [Planctomycetes bacterium]|nr:flagellar biosynthetic protein FliQ [Planctomycetota bacterium]MCB9917320.1 flagellar biosynthetic protein FliQ [Planctomycetota bacterium]